MAYVVAYFGSLITFLIIDMIWLNFVAKDFYRNEMGDILKDEFNYAAAGIFYLFYIVGVVYFVLKPIIEASANGNEFGLSKVLISGALLGLVAYGTYDFTNYAIMKGYTLKVTIVDVIWGGFVTAATSAGGYYALKLFGKI